MAIYEDNLIVATSDAHLLALDVKTGKVVWDHTDRRLDQGLALHQRPVRRRRQDHSGHDRLRQCAAGRLLHHRRTTRRPARSSGASIRSRSRRSRTATPGTACRSRAASAAPPGSPAATIPSQNVVFFGTGQPYPWIAEMSGLLAQEGGLKNNALYTDSTLAIDPNTGKLKWYRQHLANDTWDLDYVYERMLIDLHGQRQDAQGAGHHRQARHHRGDRPHQRRMALAQGDGAPERRGGDRSEDRREDHQPRRRSRTSARPRSTARPTRAAVAGRQPPTARRPACSTCRSTSIAPTRRRSRSIPVRPIPAAAARSSRACRCRTATAISAASTRSSSPTSRRLVVPAARAADQRGAADRRRLGVRRRPGPLLPGASTTRPARCSGRSGLNNAVNSFPVTYTANGKQYVAVAVGQWIEPGALARDADARDQESGRRLGALGVRAAELKSKSGT